MKSANAVAITSLSEGLTCLVGVICYALIAKDPFDLSVMPWLCIGAVASVPFSTITVRKIKPKTLKFLIALLTIALGILTLYKTICG
jgi:uncharacterized membrane protein YfcA